MDFVIKAIILMLILTFGPVVCYVAIGLVMVIVAAIFGKK